jgi:Cellulose synthase subunit D
MDIPYMDQAPGRIGTQTSSHTSRAAPQWRDFLRALVAQIDASMDAAGRNRMLKAVGARMAGLMPLSPVESLDALEIEMSEAIAAMGWGSVTVRLNEADRALVLSHEGLPAIGSAGDPPGTGYRRCWRASTRPGLPASRAVRQVSRRGWTPCRAGAS